MKKSLRRNKRKLELMLLSNPEYFGHQATTLKKEINNAETESTKQAQTEANRARRLQVKNSQEYEDSGGSLREDISQIDDVGGGKALHGS